MKSNIAIVNSKSFGLYSNALETLKELGTIERIEVPRDLRGSKLAEALRDYDVIIASVTPYYDEDFFRYNSRVRMIARHGIGIDNVDVDAATRFGVVVTRVPGHVEREAVAEHAVALILAALRNLINAHLKVVEGRWGERGKFVCHELRSLKVGLIGIGNIGSRVAEILTKGFNAKVIAYDPYVSAERARELGVELVDLDTLISESDIISIHAPLTKETYHLINEDRLRRMKRSAIIVNTARGGLIDTDALVKALRDGWIAGAALDVTDPEPLPPDHPLYKLPNVIITPHIAAFTYEGLKGMDEAVVKAIKDFLTGNIPDGIVNREVYERGLRR